MTDLTAPLYNENMVVKRMTMINDNRCQYIYHTLPNASGSEVCRRLKSCNGNCGSKNRLYSEYASMIQNGSCVSYIVKWMFHSLNLRLVMNVMKVREVIHATATELWHVIYNSQIKTNKRKLYPTFKCGTYKEKKRPYIDCLTRKGTVSC